MALSVTHVDDPDDPVVADYRRLNDVAARRTLERDVLLIAEGPTAVDRLAASGHRVRSALVASTKLARLEPLLASLGAPILVAAPDVLTRIVGFDLHRGLVAAADRPPLRDLDELVATARRLAVLEGLNDPENLGAVARSARAFGVDGLVLDPTCIDPYTRRTVRVSLGEVLLLPVARATDWPRALDVLHDHGFETWAMTPAGDADDVWTLDVPSRLAVVLGAEGPGLRAATVAAATRRVRIPIAPDVDSLNVGAAAAVTFAVTSRAR